MNKMFLHARSKRGAQVSGRLARARSGASQNKDTNAMMQSIRTPLSKFAAIFDTDEFLRKFLMVLAMARKGSEKVRVISIVVGAWPICSAWADFNTANTEEGFGLVGPQNRVPPAPRPTHDSPYLRL